ncbi:MAG: D-hexose-6-phosphate mutarotase, partial [Gammaproteobacteria bacterium]|nr:D-hexose-6-phosphate mutarotase [Gammaproteobacteria bacterium]
MNEIQNGNGGDEMVTFCRSEEGIELIEISTPLATATLSLQGGQLLQWQPRGEEGVIWLS